MDNTNIHHIVNLCGFNIVDNDIVPNNHNLKSLSLDTFIYLYEQYSLEDKNLLIKLVYKTSKNKNIIFRYLNSINRNRPSFLWKNNSCYVDCVIFCLFYLFNDYMTVFFDDSHLGQNLVNIQLFLNNPKISNGYLNIRKYISDYDNNQMADASEFLYSLFSMFKTETCIHVIKRYKNIGQSKYELVNQTNNKGSPILRVGKNEYNSDKFLLSDKFKLGLYYELHDQNLNSYNITNLKDLLIIQIDRARHGNIVDDFPLFPNEEIDIFNKDFSLFSLICFNNNHYTCLFKDRNQWYHYNDISDQPITYIGGFDLVLKQHDIIRSTVLAFYNNF